MRKLAMAAMVMGVAGLWASQASAAPAKAPEAGLIEECKNKQPPVNFDHAKHDKIDCSKCHHTNKDLKAGANVEVKNCGTCHNAPEKAETPACKEMSAKKNPYHIACIGCHKTEKKGPTVCKDCHKK